jgi:CBS-domain-containing membrane protein
LSNLFTKLRGDKQPIPKHFRKTEILIAGIGSFIAIGCLGLLTNITGQMLILASFGATCVLLFGFPDIPFSQPRNILFGHLICSLTALVFYHLVSTHWWSMALATSIGIVFMMLSRTVHPPAASNLLIVFVLKSDWSFLFFPTFFGTVIVISVGLLYHNFTRETNYPKYW